MTSSTDFDRLLSSWLETAGPPDARPEVVRGAIETAASVGQRGRVAGLLIGPATWPRPRRGPGFAGLPPALRVAVVVGLAIALASATVIGSGKLRGLMVGPASTAPAGATSWDAVYLRPVSGTPSADVAVYLVRPDGQERLVRRLSRAALGGDSRSDAYGLLSRDGWLAIGPASAQGTSDIPGAPYGQYAIVSLAEPGRAPVYVPQNGATGGRWSSTGLFAVPKPNDFWIDIVDPRTGATTELGQVFLFGGGPSIVWASDGSGILDGGRLRPVDGSPDILIDPALRFDDRRVGMGGHTIEACPLTYGTGDGDCAGASVPTVRVFDVGQTTFVDWYSSADATEQIGFNPVFAGDGQRLLLTLDRVVNGSHQAVVAMAQSPYRLTTLASIPLPADAFYPGLWGSSPDESQLLLTWETGTRGNPQPGPLLVIGRDGSQRPPPVGSFLGYVEAAQAESWPALGDFGPSTP